MPEPWRIIDILDWAHADLRAHGVERPRLDAELLLGKALELDRLQIYTNFDRPLTPEERTRYRNFHRRRRQREPVAYILGHREFHALDMKVSRDVLIPRPETEHVVETTLELVTSPSALILDVGTGSGCIACALSRSRKDWVVTGIDNSPAALAVARSNAVKHALSIEFLEGDLLHSIEPTVGPDAIVSNPPYVCSDELAGAMPELGYEPRSALDGGPDGLGIYRRLIPQAASRLKPGGWLILEIGARQAQDVSVLMSEQGCLEEPIVRQDLAGRDRVVAARRFINQEDERQ